MGDELRNNLDVDANSTPQRVKKKMTLNAINKYQKAKKDDACDDVLELTELTGASSTFDSVDWNAAHFQSMASPEK